jgi:hypothetical protein
MQQEKLRQEQIQKKKIIGNNISDTVFVIIKWKIIKNNIQIKKKKKLKLIATYFVPWWLRVRHSN